MILSGFRDSVLDYSCLLFCTGWVSVQGLVQNPWFGNTNSVQDRKTMFFAFCKCLFAFRFIYFLQFAMFAKTLEIVMFITSFILVGIATNIHIKILLLKNIAYVIYLYMMHVDN